MSATLPHRVSVKASLGALEIDAAFTLTAPWTVLFGPSGCGKTSILRAIGGTLPNADVAFARNQEHTIWSELSELSPDNRSLAYAPQSGALFPHLNVRENIAFPSSISRDKTSYASLVDEAMVLFALQPLAKRMPKDLSGGERQRVNLARAFAVPESCLLLLDEPFTGLDRARRDELLPAMKQWCIAKRVQVLSVTHDVDEALLLSAEVIRITNGKVVGQCAAGKVLAEERERLLQVLTGVSSAQYGR